MPYCFLGLGSNLSSPKRQLLLAIQSIKCIPRTVVLAVAPAYRNPAWGKKAAPDFYNTVVLINTALSPFLLLQHCQLIEHKQKRVRSIRNQARTIDIDLLTHGQIKLAHPKLTLPHPRMNERDFVQIPLSKIQDMIR